MANYIFLDSANVVTLSHLRDEMDRAFVDNAVATLDLYTDAGAPVDGAQGIAMTVEPGATPAATQYWGEIPASVTLVEHAMYDARVTAVANGAQRVFHIACKAAKG